MSQLTHSATQIDETIQKVLEPVNSDNTLLTKESADGLYDEIGSSAANASLLATKQGKSGVIQSGGDRIEIKGQNFGLNDFTIFIDQDIILQTEGKSWFSTHDAGNNRILIYPVSGIIRITFVDDAGSVATYGTTTLSSSNLSDVESMYFDRDGYLSIIDKSGATLEQIDISATSSINIGDGNTNYGFIGSADTDDSMVVRHYASWIVLFDSDQQAALANYGPDYVNARWPEIAVGGTIYATSTGTASNNYNNFTSFTGSVGGFDAINGSSGSRAIIPFDTSKQMSSDKLYAIHGCCDSITSSNGILMAMANDAGGGATVFIVYPYITSAGQFYYIVSPTADVNSYGLLLYFDASEAVKVSDVSMEEVGCTCNLPINEGIGRLALDNSGNENHALLPESAEWILPANRGEQFTIIDYPVEAQTGTSLYLQGETDAMVPDGVRVTGFEIEIESGSIDSAYIQFEADSDGTLTTITEVRTLEDAYDDLVIIKDTEKLGGSGALLLKGTFNTLTGTIRVLGEKIK